MIRDIVTDRKFLNQKCVPVPPKKVAEVVADLLDTGRHLYGKMAGLAANQIGYQYRAFIVKDDEGKLIPFVNPEIVSQGGGKTAMQEGCLSFPGKMTFRSRFNEVQVKSEGGAVRTFTGFPAKAVQHEMDHCDGILI
jgi:peptide deformylase